MPSLFQIWLQKARRGKTPTELLYTNPGKAKIGATCTIDVLDFREYTFKVTRIREYTRTIRGIQSSFTDYDLDGIDVQKKIRLRYMPQAQKTATGNSSRVICLKLEEDHEYNADEHGALKADTGEFEIFGDDEQLESRWFRIDDVRGAYYPFVVNIRDENGDGVVNDNEVSQEKLEYWDFNRQIKSEGGNDVVEYLFVEIADGTGWIQTFRGPEIDGDRVSWA
jgi:hypothetical protein